MLCGRPARPHSQGHTRPASEVSHRDLRRSRDTSPRMLASDKGGRLTGNSTAFNYAAIAYAKSLSFAFIFFRLFYQASRALDVLTTTALNPVETCHPPSLRLVLGVAILRELLGREARPCVVEATGGMPPTTARQAISATTRVSEGGEQKPHGSSCQQEAPRGATTLLV